jgi:hypothetical protein
MNAQNKNLAIPAAPAAIPPNPKIAAMIAITRNITVQRNITLLFYGYTICFYIQVKP